jgi:hypothetical protein
LLIEWVKKRVCDVTEAGTSSTPVTGREAGMGGWCVSDMCLHKERSCRIQGQSGAVAIRFWYLPLGVVLKRE